MTWMWTLSIAWGGAAEPSACGAHAERLAPTVGHSQQSATGLTIAFEGIQHDQLEGGLTNTLASFTLWTGEDRVAWLPSVMGPARPQTFLGHCVQLTVPTGDPPTLWVAPVGPPKRLLRCEDTTTPRLDDYGALKDGQAFHVVVSRQPGGPWEPTPTPKSPHHHSSHLTWQGLALHPELLLAYGPVRLEATLVEHTVESVFDRRWRAQYVAQVHSVCAVEGAGAYPP